MPLYDVRCEGCGYIEEDVQSRFREWGPCPKCGQEREKTVLHAPHLDIWGGPQYSVAHGRWFDTKDEMRKLSKQWGMRETGDSEGGAKPDHKIKGTIFSDGGKH